MILNRKVQFLAINSRYTHSCLALFYLRTIIRDLSYDCQIVEYSINDQYLDICDGIDNSKPDILVLSVYIWNKEIIEYLLRDIKKVLPELIIVIGGPEASYNVDYYRDKYPVDYIVTGAGEKAFYELASSGFQDSNSVIQKENYSFSQIAFPYLESDKEQLRNKYVYYESSRGCPFKCSYCLSSRSDQALEYKAVEQVKEELLSLISFSPNIIKFIDRSFNVDKAFAKAIWSYLIDLNPNCIFHFEIHPLFIDDEMLEILAKSPKGLFQFEIGVQSVNKQTIHEINRDSNWDEIESKVKGLFEIKNIHYHLDQIAGLPFEDYNSLRNSFNKIISLKPDHYQTGVLKVLYGTEMYEKQLEYGIKYSDKTPYQIFSTKWLNYEELQEYIAIDHVIDTIYNAKHFYYFKETLFVEARDIYNAFLAISKSLQLHKIKKNEKNFQKIFSVITEAIEEIAFDPHDKVLLFDSLRLDWAVLSQAHYYPEKLRGEICDEFRQITWSFIKEHREKDYFVYQGVRFTLSDLRKARFYRALDIEGLIVIDANTIIKWVKP